MIWRLGVQVFDAIRLCGANLLFKVQTLNPVEGFRGFRSFGSGVQDLGLGCLGVLDRFRALGCKSACKHPCCGSQALYANV